MQPLSALKHPHLIKRHVRTIVVCLLTVCTFILLLAYIQALSMRSAGAYVRGEGLWAKAQKDAVYWLRDYISAPDEAKWKAFEQALEVCLSDREARLALMHNPPQKDVARDSLIAGGNHPDDIDTMVTGFLLMQDVPHVQRAIAIWTEADSHIIALQQLATRVRQIMAGSSTPPAFTAEIAELSRLNTTLTTMEVQFSNELSDGVRWLEACFLWLSTGAFVLMLAIVSWIGRRLFPKIDEMEADLRASEHQYKTLHDSELIGVISWAADGQIHAANPAFLNMVGHTDNTPDTVLNWRTMTPPEHLEADERHLVQLRDHGYCTPFYKDFFHKNGERVSTLFAPALAPGYRDRGMAFVVDRTLERKMEQDIKKLAHHDGLTGLPNRSLFDDRLENTIARAHRNQEKFAVMFIDLDRFKPVNDQYGHAVGDVLLQQIANRWRVILRDCDTLARLGGDEFVLIVEDVSSPESALTIAKKLMEGLEESFIVEGHTLSVGCSIGISFYPEHGSTPVDLTRAADFAMYVAKAEVESNIRIFDFGILATTPLS